MVWWPRTLAHQLLTCLYLSVTAVRSIWIIVVVTLAPAAAAAAEPGSARSLAVWLRDARAPAPELATGVPAEAPPTAPLVAPGQRLHALLRTGLGTIDCTLEHESAPYSVRAFVDLARGVRPWIDPDTGEAVARPLYDGTLFHRVVPGFLVQGGDPTGTGTGGPGFVLADEVGVESRFDRAGVLGLAHRGPNTGGSQFFITAGPAHHLDGRYTRLGVCGDLDVVASIAGAPRGERDRPARPVVLRRVEIVARGG